MMTRAALVAAVAWLAAGCAPELRDGAYACTDDASCPEGWTCSVGRCSRGGQSPECRIDLHCDDGSVCTLDICESGRCSHEPQDAACDDGDFCNGADACSGGLCANIGPVPCPPETCTSAGCGTCGALGGPCCDGVCAEGTCVGATCEVCGAEGQVCCAGECTSPGLACDGAACVRCGGDAQPCCALGACDMPFTCLGTVCGYEPGCESIECGDAYICIAGMCVECGKLDQPCCAGGWCSDSVCNPGTSTCVAAADCGGRGEMCCMTNPECDEPGLVCVADMTIARCVPCGGVAGAPCCPPESGLRPCGPGLVCGSLVRACEPCGGHLQRCCDGGSCNPGPDGTTMPCVMGFCRNDCGNRGQRCCAGRCGSGLVCNPDMICV